VCSDGAPSARNLIVTVFGDTCQLAGDDAELTVQQLTELLAGFGVNERLVRTSLSRIAGDGLLATRAEGRRSFYRVAPEARSTFRTADRRIYRGGSVEWDGAWTLVVLDATESTAARRARLRQELSWAGFGVVAPNVMASPVVGPDEAAAMVDRVGGFRHVLVSRSTVVEGNGLLGQDELARRSADLGEVERRYGEFADRFEAFGDDDLAALDPARAFKLRTLLVSAFRRIALADPQLPRDLLDQRWPGDRARAEAARVYAAVAVPSDRHIAAVTGLAVHTPPDRFRTVGIRYQPFVSGLLRTQAT
jgi:phenylacetic acid degradation operon negative regulatory protein